MGMRDSKPNSLLSGILLTGFVFVVLWVGFSWALAVSMLFGGHFFQPRWYENLIVIGGGGSCLALAQKDGEVDYFPPCDCSS